MPPKTLVITGYGINCEEEIAYCFNKAEGQAEIVHINDLIDGHKRMSDYQILAIPGGFSYGDDTGAGNALSNRIRNHLNDKILSFVEKDKLAIGICNGFQMITNLGLVPATKNQYGKREVVLMWNTTARYECRWIHVKNTSKKCVWTREIDTLLLPIAHGEGNLYATPEILKEMKRNDQIALKYIKEDGSPANIEFPYNPNGALEDIAGITDPSGRLFGLMPHPERLHSFFNYPTWTLEKELLSRQEKISSTSSKSLSTGEGLQIFRNAIEYFT